MSITLIVLMLFALSLLYFAQFLFKAVLRSGSGERLEPLSLDPQGIRSHVTFKPLPRFTARAMRASAPYHTAMMTELCERLRQRGARIDRFDRVGDAERVRITFDQAKWELTLGQFQTHPEQWLLTTDRLLGRKKSAPHACAETRAMLTLIKSILEGMDVSTLRWHTRQDWNANRVDVWSHKPF